MRFATIRVGNVPMVALIDHTAEYAWPLENSLGRRVSEMLELICRFDVYRPLIARFGEPLSLSDVRIDAPVPRPARNIFCVGKNYMEHAREFHRSGMDRTARPFADEDVSEHPIVFSKVPETVIADGVEIRYPSGVSDCVDYEAELAVIIGVGGRGIGKREALQHVWGYTIINDVTARDLQSRHQQWLLGKSLDTFCPMGPCVVTADEFSPQSASIRCWVNDELRQDANTRDLIFDIPTLIAAISAGTTLNPGDIIATGTPSGVGIGFDPPRYLRRGDRVAIEIEGIGRLSNPVSQD